MFTPPRWVAALGLCTLACVGQQEIVLKLPGTDVPPPEATPPEENEEVVQALPVAKSTDSAPPHMSVEEEGEPKKEESPFCAPQSTELITPAPEVPSEDLALFSTFDAGEVLVYELAWGNNPPAELRKEFPVGISGGQWWLEAEGSDYSITRTYYLRLGDELHLLGHGHTTHEDTEEWRLHYFEDLNFLQLERVSKDREPDEEGTRYVSTQVSLIELTNPPKVRFNRETQSKLWGIDGYLWEKANLSDLTDTHLLMIQAKHLSAQGRTESYIEDAVKVNYCSPQECPRPCELDVFQEVGTIEVPPL